MFPLVDAPLGERAAIAAEAPGGARDDHAAMLLRASNILRCAAAKRGIDAEGLRPAPVLVPGGRGAPGADLLMEASRFLRTAVRETPPGAAGPSPRAVDLERLLGAALRRGP
mmetsp:Transcript_28901/g.82172  ORF Transcript_28901/g.82172 Transcript_28901/m.82172 type:complete len:112 (+) Transcript_28901:192-527(+)